MGVLGSGYIVVDIDSAGYVKDAVTRNVIHRETRGIHRREQCVETLGEAKADLRKGNTILQVDKEGGGEAVWVLDSDRDEITARLSKFKGCYGLWELRRLNG